MSSIRKLERNERTAAANLRRARADLVAARHSDGPTDAVGQSLNEQRPDIAALKRRVGAYTAQWEAASRKLEQAVERAL
jgi:hypothetical protein